MKEKMHNALKIAVSVTPWIASMYLLYGLGKFEIWVPETPYRDLMTVAIMVTGMVMSYFLYSYFFKISKR